MIDLELISSVRIETANGKSSVHITFKGTERTEEISDPTQDFGRFLRHHLRPIPFEVMRVENLEKPLPDRWKEE